MKTMTVWVVLPDKPEHFAYGPYRSEEAALQDPAMKYQRPEVTRSVIGGQFPTVVKRHRSAAVKRIEAVPVYVDPDDGKEYPNLTYANAAIWPRRISHI